MAAIGRGKTRTKQATKQDIAERVSFQFILINSALPIRLHTYQMCTFTNFRENFPPKNKNPAKKSDIEFLYN